MKIVASLPPSWLHNAEFLNAHRNTWTVNWLKERILEQEYFRNTAAAVAQSKGHKAVAPMMEEEQGVAAAVGPNKGKGKGKGKAGGDSHSSGPKNKSLPFVRYDEEGCWYCRKQGHTWRECRSKPANWKPGMKAQAQGGGAAAVQVQDEQGWAFVMRTTGVRARGTGSSCNKGIASTHSLGTGLRSNLVHDT